MDAKRFITPWFVATFVAVGSVLLSSGCVGFLAQVGYWTGGATVAAEFTDLEGQRVAVICVSQSSSLGPGTDTLLLARGVGDILSRKVKDIEIVRPDEIADWVDRNDWDEYDYVEAGKGVNADMVVVVELSGFRLYDGQTLYKGRANLNVAVLDLNQGGKEVFRRRMPELSFPTNGGYPATDVTEATFRRRFVTTLAERAATFFVEHEVWDEFGRDPASLG